MDKWIHYIQQAGLDMIPYPFVLVQEMDKQQFRRKGKFAQKFAGHATVAKIHGMNEKGFTMDMERPYNRLDSEFKRRLAVIYIVPIPENKLRYRPRKRIVRTDGKSVELLIGPMNTYCPEGRSLLDGYRGSLMTAIAALRSARTCVVSENDSECFRVS